MGDCIWRTTAHWHGGMRVREWVTVALWIGIFIASVVVEQVCGVYSESCNVDWSGVYGRQAPYYHLNVCIAPSADSGLGIPMLSVSSFFLLLPVVYVGFESKFTVLSSLALGIGSFLYHANNTRASATVDYVGIVTLGPALFCDAAAVAADRFSAVCGIPVRAVRIGLVLLFLAVLGFGVACRTLVGYHRTLDLYVYVSQGIAPAAIFLLLWGEGRDGFRYYLGLLVLIAGCIVLIVATSYRNKCEGVDTELERPHFYGHVLVGTGATVLAAMFIAPRGLKSAKSEDQTNFDESPLMPLTGNTPASLLL